MQAVSQHAPLEGRMGAGHVEHGGPQFVGVHAVDHGLMEINLLVDGSSNDYRNPIKSCRCTMVENTATQLHGILTASIKLEEIYKARHKAVRKHVDPCVIEYH